MQPISKQEFNYLVQKGVLRQSKGNYGDNLVVTGKFGKSRGKTRYITTPVYNYLLRLQEQDKQDINKIKDNQKYMFSNNSNSERVS